MKAKGRYVHVDPLKDLKMNYRAWAAFVEGQNARGLAAEHGYWSGYPPWQPGAYFQELRDRMQKCK